MQKKAEIKIIPALLSWYSKHKRDLPWRHTKDPYCIWISEIMLQQTQVITVIDYYHRFLKKFPTIQSLAKADEKDVLALWSGLGYYSRARNLHKAAQKIVKDFEGKFPNKAEDILSLPGIGRYTLGAIASIAFNQGLPLVDGNVIRVYSRLFAFKGSPSDAKFQKKIWEIAEEIIAKPLPSFGDFNQALMELGATICTPQNPTCLICPVQNLCRVRSQSPENYPEKKKSAEVKKLQRLTAVVKSKDEVLLCLSPKHRWMKQLWHLPGLFVKNQKGQVSLLKHLQEMGITKPKLKALESIQHQVTHHQITIQPFIFESSEKILANKEGERYEWHPLQELKQLGIPAADRKILESIL